MKRLMDLAGSWPNSIQRGSPGKGRKAIVVSQGHQRGGARTNPFCEEAESLVQSLRNEIPVQLNHHFNIDVTPNKHIKIHNDFGFYISFPAIKTGGLGAILGFKNPTEPKQQVISEYSTDLIRESFSLQIYSDLVSLQLVGDGYAPLLRSVPALSRNQELMLLTYADIHYLQLAKQTIDVLITNELGEKPQFIHGRSLLKG